MHRKKPKRVVFVLSKLRFLLLLLLFIDVVQSLLRNRDVLCSMKADFLGWLTESTQPSSDLIFICLMIFGFRGTLIKLII